MRRRSLVVAFLLLGVSVSAITLLPGYARAETLYVGSGGLGDYETIQDAIDNATDGDTVYVYSGTYQEAVSVQKPINLVGQDRRTTVIDTEGSGIPVNVSSDWVNVTGFSIRNGGTNEPGVMLYGVSECNIIMNAIADNDNGVFLWNSSRNTLLNNSIYQNDVRGVYLHESDENAVIGNNVSSNNVLGIVLQDSKRNSIDYNAVSSNGWGGIELLRSTANNMNGNTITLSPNFGVLLDRSDNNTLSDNVVSSINGTGISLESSSGNLVFHNQLRNNSAQAFDNTGVNMWDGGYPTGGNYWSDYVGIDEMMGIDQDEPGIDGIGDTPHSIPGVGNEDRYPVLWLGNQHPVCEIIHPEEHDRIHETYTVTGTADDEDGNIVRVEIRIGNDTWIDAYGNETWRYEWDTTNVTNGEYTIYARSYDGINYSAEVHVIVDVHNPTAEEKTIGEVFFWVMLVLVIIIAVGGIALEVRRRKKD